MTWFRIDQDKQWWNISMNKIVVYIDRGNEN